MLAFPAQPLTLAFQLREQTATPGDDVSISRVEIAGVPRVGHVLAVAGVIIGKKIEQAHELLLRIAAEDRLKAVQVLPVHVDEKVPLAVFARPHLPRMMGMRGNALFTQLFNVPG